MNDRKELRTMLEDDFGFDAGEKAYEDMLSAILMWQTAKLNGARIDLLERVKSEVIGLDPAVTDPRDEAQAKIEWELREWQRSALQKIEEEI